MTPYKYTVDKDTTYFHYTIKQYREFIKYSYEGVAGVLLVSRNNHYHINKYKVSGTLEKSRPIKRMKDLLTFTVKHSEIFDGKELTNDQICEQPLDYSMFPTESLRIIYID